MFTGTVTPGVHWYCDSRCSLALRQMYTGIVTPDANWHCDSRCTLELWHQMQTDIVTVGVHWHCDTSCTLTLFVVLDVCAWLDAPEVQTDSSPAINSAYLKCHKYHVIFGSDMVLCLILKNSHPYNTLARCWLENAAYVQSHYCVKSLVVCHLKVEKKYDFKVWLL